MDQGTKPLLFGMLNDAIEPFAQMEHQMKVARDGEILKIQWNRYRMIRSPGKQHQIDQFREMKHFGPFYIICYFNSFNGFFGFHSDLAFYDFT